MRTHPLFYMANLLSLGRLVLTAPLAYLIWLDSPRSNFVLIALVLVAVATDMLDGYFARRLGQQSELGRILDPVADKVMIAVLVACLVAFRDFPLMLLIGLLSRDAYILFLGAVVSRRQKRVVEASIWGKLNTIAFAVTGTTFLLGIRGWLLSGLVSTCYLTLAVSGILYYRSIEHVLAPARRWRLALRLSVGVLFAALIGLAAHAMWVGLR